MGLLKLLNIVFHNEYS